MWYVTEGRGAWNEQKKIVDRFPSTWYMSPKRMFYIFSPEQLHALSPSKVKFEIAIWVHQTGIDANWQRKKISKIASEKYIAVRNRLDKISLILIVVDSEIEKEMRKETNEELTRMNQMFVQRNLICFSTNNFTMRGMIRRRIRKSIWNWLIYTEK